LSEGKILQYKLPTVSKEANEDSEPEGEEVEHGPEL
jgi:hypothetical protein